MMDDGSEPPFVCPACGEGFRRWEYRSRSRHLARHGLLLYWKCPACPYRTASRRFHDHVKHWRAVHSGARPAPLAQVEADGAQTSRQSARSSATSGSCGPTTRSRSRSPRGDPRHVKPEDPRGPVPRPATPPVPARPGPVTTPDREGRRVTPTGLRCPGVRPAPGSPQPGPSRALTPPRQPSRRKATPPVRRQRQRLVLTSEEEEGNPVALPVAEPELRSPAWPNMPTGDELLARAQTPPGVQQEVSVSSSRQARETECVLASVSTFSAPTVLVNDADGDPISIDLHPQETSDLEDLDLGASQVLAWLRRRATPAERELIRREVAPETPTCPSRPSRNRRVQVDLRPLMQDRETLVRPGVLVTSPPGGGLQVVGDRFTIQVSGPLAGSHLLSE